MGVWKPFSGGSKSREYSGPMFKPTFSWVDYGPLNPNPKKFTLKELFFVNGYMILHLNYPECRNYKGNKILVFDKNNKPDLEKVKELDPHFLEEGLSPIARFKPDEYGMTNAITFCEALSE